MDREQGGKPVKQPVLKMSKESIQGPLSALRNAGTVSGLCLTRGTEALINMLPYSDQRMEELAAVLDDVFYYFESSHREVDQFALGFDGANLVVVTEGEFRLLVVHLLSEEVDFIAKAARAFLIDFRLGLFAEELDARNAAVASLPPGGGAEELRPVADSQPEPGVAATPTAPKIRPLAPISKEEAAKDEIELEEAADAAGTKTPAKPVRKTTRIPRKKPVQPAAAAPPSPGSAELQPAEETGPASDPEPAPPAAIPEPTLIAWSAKKESSPVPPPAAPEATPTPPPASLPVSAQRDQPKPTAIRTRRAPAPEKPEPEPPAARHRAHLAPNQPESTLPPRRMPRR